MKGKVILPVLLVVLGIVAWTFWSQLKETVPQEADVVACTMDAMQCPDGSWVGRTGPNCEFVC